MTYLYLLINIASLSIPLAYSFEKRMNFKRYWNPVFLGILIVAIPFLIWDVWFTKTGVWGFNPQYHLSINILGLPLEEILFFICIPYASLFIHYSLYYFFPKLKLSLKYTKIFTLLLIAFALSMALFNTNKWYTLINFLVLALVLAYAYFKNIQSLSKFYISFLLILIPFFIVNGILTGSFIENEVVWYNNAENLGIRLFTIPVEDVFYAFSLLFGNYLVIEYLKLKFKN